MRWKWWVWPLQLSCCGPWSLRYKNLCSVRAVPDDSAAIIERASFALIEYLEGVLAGQPVSPVALFPPVPATFKRLRVR